MAVYSVFSIKKPLTPWTGANILELHVRITIPVISFILEIPNNITTLTSLSVKNSGQIFFHIFHI